MACLLLVLLWGLLPWTVTILLNEYRSNQKLAYFPYQAKHSNCYPWFPLWPKFSNLPEPPHINFDIYIRNLYFCIRLLHIFRRPPSPENISVNILQLLTCNDCGKCKDLWNRSFMRLACSCRCRWRSWCELEKWWFWTNFFANCAISCSSSHGQSVALQLSKISKRSLTSNAILTLFHEGFSILCKFCKNQPNGNVVKRHLDQLRLGLTFLWHLL